MIELKPPTIEVMIRIRVLHKVVEELVKAFYPNANLEIIKKGILERQYLKRLYIFFLNKNGNKVGEVILTIDWDKHYVAADTLNNGTFNIDTTKSFNEQLSELFPKIIKYTQTIKQHLNVDGCEMWFSWRDEVYNNEEMLKEAYQYCGLSQDRKSEEPKWETLKTNQMEVEFTPERLNELGLKITHFK
ncbi:hypothetical protein [Bacteroides congonensis]